MVWRWWWPSGTITSTILAFKEGRGKSDQGRGSGRGGIRFREEEGLTGSRLGVVAHQCPSDGRWSLGDGRRKLEGGRGPCLVGRLAC
jgi:hypothetical protein